MPTNKSVSYVKEHLDEVLDGVRESRGAVTVTQNGQPRAVIVDYHSYEKTRSALGLLKLVAMGEKDIQAGRTVPQKEVFADARRRIRLIRSVD
jgi:prevent-host-death family protein